MRDTSSKVGSLVWWSALPTAVDVRGLRLTDRLGSEAVYFPYIPLNEAGRTRHVLERAKSEDVLDTSSLVANMRL